MKATSSCWFSLVWNRTEYCCFFLKKLQPLFGSQSKEMDLEVNLGRIL